MRFEAARRQGLASSSEAWNRAAQLRSFMMEIDRRITSGEEVATEAIRQWQAWANKVTDDLDPLVRGLTQFLNDQDAAANKAADVQSNSGSRFTEGLRH